MTILPYKLIYAKILQSVGSAAEVLQVMLRDLIAHWIHATPLKKQLREIRISVTQSLPLNILSLLMLLLF
jgi:hypothetical protein